MGGRSLLVLFGVVAGLLAFVWFVERDLPGSDERAELEKRVLGVEAESLKRLAWVGGGEAIALERDGDDWRLTSPVEARADGAAAEALAGALAQLEKRRTLEEVTAADVGIDSPRTIVELVVNGEPGRLLVGLDVPASDSMVVASSEQGPFHVVSQELWTELDKPIDDWRSRQVLAADPEDVTRIVIEGEAGRTVLARRDGDFWLEEPLEDRADPGTVTRLLSTLTGLEVVEFVEPAGDASYGLDRPQGAFEVAFGDGSTWTLELGAPAGAVEGDGGAAIFARAEGQTYRIADRLREAAGRPLEGWRSFQWLTVENWEIDHLLASDASGEVELQREGGQWARDGEEIAFDVVSDLLYAITGSKAVALDAEPPAAVAELTLTVNPGAAEEVLEVYPAVDERHPATTTARPGAIWLGADRLRDLRSRLDAVRAAEREPVVEGDADAEGETSPGTQTSKLDPEG